MSDEMIETKNELAELKEQAEEIQKELDTWELDLDDFVEQYEEMLDEIYEVNIGCMKFDASEVLRKLDPIAYHCGLIEYVDSMELEEDPNYRERTEELEELNETIEGLEEKLGDDE